jgi:hypothetical protein
MQGDACNGGMAMLPRIFIAWLEQAKLETCAASCAAPSRSGQRVGPIDTKTDAPI